MLAINDAYRLAPWADALYACDGKWWGWHPSAVAFAGIKITQDLRTAQAHAGVQYIECVKGDRHSGHKQATGLSRAKHKIHGGQNGGYQAINLAYLFGAARIVLLGYDMRDMDRKSHWFGDHPNKMPSNGKYLRWIEFYKTIAAQLPELGIEIINCTPGSALKCFPMRKLEDVL